MRKRWWTCVIRLSILWLAVPLAIGAAGALPVDDALRAVLLPLLLALVGWPMAGFVSAVWGVRNLLAQQRLCGVLAFTPAVYVAVCLGAGTRMISDPVTSSAFTLNDFVHFAEMKPTYDSIVHRDPDGPRLHVFLWEEDPIGGSAIIYDPGDELALPRYRRPKPWLERVVADDRAGALSSLCRTRRMWSHYYIVSFGCDGNPQ